MGMSFVGLGTPAVGFAAACIDLVKRSPQMRPALQQLPKQALIFGEQIQ
jgi:hypothetical protein